MDYNELLDLTLEIEGLIMLKLERGESAPANADDLLRRKIADLQHFAAEGCNCTEAQTDAADAGEIARSARFEEREDAFEAAPEPMAADEPAEDPEAEVEEAVSEAERVAETTAPTVADTLAADEPSVNDAAGAAAAGDITKVFTINDKFRFRRELFRNSDVEFAETINVLRAMSSLEEAEDYLYNDLAWDPESDDVKDFIRLIAPCYRS